MRYCLFCICIAVCGATTVEFEVRAPDKHAPEVSTYVIGEALSVEASAFRACVRHAEADGVGMRRAVVHLRKSIAALPDQSGGAAEESTDGPTSLERKAMVRLNRADFEGAAVLLHDAHRALYAKKREAARIAALLTDVIAAKRLLGEFDAAAERGDWNAAGLAARMLETTVINAQRLQEVKCHPHYGCALKITMMVRRVRALSGQGRGKDAADIALKMLHMRRLYGNKRDLSARQVAYDLGLSSALESSSGATAALLILEMEGVRVGVDPRAPRHINQMDRYVQHLLHAKKLVEAHSGQLEHVLLSLEHARNAAAELQATLLPAADEGLFTRLGRAAARLIGREIAPPRIDPTWLRIRAELALVECRGRATHDITDGMTATMQMGRWYNATGAPTSATAEAEEMCARAIEIMSTPTRTNEKCVNAAWLGLAYESLGTVRLHVGDFAGAAVAFESAMAEVMARAGKTRLTEKMLNRLSFLHATTEAQGAAGEVSGVAYGARAASWQMCEAFAVRWYNRRALKKRRTGGRWAVGS